MILRTLLAHYRRHPVQALFLFASIGLANVLLAGTHLINAQARASYAEGERLLTGVPVAEIRASGGGTVSEAAYVRLRRHGHDTLVPVLRRSARTAGGDRIDLLGIDALAFPQSSAPDVPGITPGGASAWPEFSFPPFQLRAAPGRLRELGVAPGERIALDNGARLPPAHPAADPGLDGRLMVHIGVLQEATDQRGVLSALLVFPASPDRLAALADALPTGLEYLPRISGPSPAELTQSFHLNLAAMGLLAFVVGVFLTYNALAFSYTDRRELFRRLRLSGVSRAELRRALLLELAGFLAAGGLAGVLVGAEVARRLLPGVGQTLAQLYSVQIAWPDTLNPAGAWLPLVMTAAAALACVAWPLRNVLNEPLRARPGERWAHRYTARRDRILALTGVGALALCAGVTFAAGSSTASLPAAFAGLALGLLGAALCLPLLLRVVLQFAARFTPRRLARLRWLLADSRWMLGPGALALMALTLALTANSGLNTMIVSFRQATSDWLDQRLFGGLYLSEAPQPETFDAWLREHAPDTRRVERHRVRRDRTRPDGKTVQVEITSLPTAPAGLDSIRLLGQVQDARKRFVEGSGIFVSERSWRLDGWSTGDVVRACGTLPDLTVLGIYPDYGNPRSQWLVPEPLFLRCWPDPDRSTTALAGPASRDWKALRAMLLRRFDLPPDAVTERDALKERGMRVFDRTFAVTDALNLLTLIVAGIGVLCAVGAIHHHRIAHQALLASLGVRRRDRALLLFGQWGLFGALCVLVVWPFGIGLAGYLAQVVNPAAFGWSFPLLTDHRAMFRLAAVTAVALGLAVAWPSLRLLRASPGVLLQEFRT